MGGKFLVILVGIAFIGATQAVPADLTAVMLQYREICIARSGSDEGYQQVLGSIQPAKTCVLDQLDVQQLQIDAAQLNNGSGKSFFDKYCPKFNESMSCFDDTVEGIAKCDGGDFDQAKAIITSVTHKLLDLVCQNNGQLFFDAQKPEFKECIAQLKARATLECKVSDAVKKTPISRYGEEQCRGIDGTRQCFKRIVDECDAPMLFDILQVIFDAMSNAIDCKQHTTLGEPFNNTITVSEN